ncbi:MAG: hypothetical protein IJY41_04970 [Clostridia bacterium]|nr:hypothetical protein [Clostridia bacterium]
MFTKLLKYDLKSLKKFGIPICIITLGLSLVCAIDLFFLIITMSNPDVSLFGEIFSILGTVAFMFMLYGIMICASLVEIFIYIEFYKSLCTDQGYLTFTLPVKRSHIFLSKLTNSCIWSVICFVALIMGIVIIVGAGVLGAGAAGLLEGEGGFDNGDFSIPGLSFGTVVLFLLFIVSSFLNSKLLIFMAIFFASVIANKNKGIAAIGMVLGVNLIYSMVYSLVGFLVSIIVGVNSNSPVISINVTLAIYIALLVGTGVLFYFMTLRMMERKLNLP